MALLIKRAVGKGGLNQSEDVKKVIEMLNLALPKMGSSLKVSPQNGSGLLEAIYEFQWHHFKMTTGRVAPQSATLNKLNFVAFGEIVPGLPHYADQGAVAGYRTRIVQIAGREADREDRVVGIDETGKHTAKSAARLKEYFQKVLPESRTWPHTKFFEPTPEKAWCGIFASWVLTQVKLPVEWKLVGSVWGMRWASKKVTGSLEISTAKDRYYAKGDILIVREAGDTTHPTHHVIVADEVPDKNGYIATIEGNIPDFYTKRRCSVTRNLRPAQAYGHYCPFQPKEL